MSQVLRLLFLTVLFLGIATPAAAQENAPSDELSGFEKINGTKLRPATLSYDATMQMDGGTRQLSATLTCARTTTDGTDTWTIVNRIKSPQRATTDSLIVDRSSLLPVSRHRSGGASMNLTYSPPTTSGEVDVSGTMGSNGSSKPISKSLEGPTLASGVHDVIALGAMPLQLGFETVLRVFSPQDLTTKRAEFEITGTETIETTAGSFETYVVDVNVGDDYVTGTVHLRKEAPHYYVKWKTEVSTGRGTRTIVQNLSSKEMGAPSSAQ